jgi:hypothetical protein
MKHGYVNKKRAAKIKAELIAAIEGDQFAVAMQKLAKLCNYWQRLTAAKVAELKGEAEGRYIGNSDDMEVDDVPYVSETADGYWVYGCFWVPKDYHDDL